MKRHRPHKPTHRNEPDSQTVRTIHLTGKQFAETSWRVVVPFIVLGLPASVLDRALETEGLFLFISMVISAVLALVIVYRYSKQYLPEEDDKDGK